MVFEGWMSLGGTEIINNARYAAYAAELGLPVPQAIDCPQLPALLADNAYSVAGVAAAPWADTAAPESAGFAGLFVHNITGLDSATSTRTVAQTISDGGVPGPARSGPRTVLVSAFMAATSQLSLAYGLAWLDAVLRDDCDDACGGATLCMIAACPSCDVSTEPAATTCWGDVLRTLHDVVVVDGPKAVAWHELSGGCAETGGAVGVEIEFTLVAAIPYIFRAPEIVAAELTFTNPAPLSGCAVEWVPVGAGRGACPTLPSCEPPSGCLPDEYTLPALPPQRGAQACVVRFQSAHALANAPIDLLPRHLDSVPVITVTAGAADMRRLTIRVYANPRLADIEDPDELDECSALTELNVTLLPRDTQLVIDGRTQQAYIICPGGGTEPADAVLFGPDGGPFEWPLITCGGALTVLGLVDADHHHEDATLDVSLAVRLDVA